MYYKITFGPPRPDSLTLLELKFGEPADNDKIVPAAIQAIQSLNLPGGKGILFNGAASLPVGMALAHAVAHLYQFVACYDPKMAKYVVAISHSPAVRPGDLIA